MSKISEKAKIKAEKLYLSRIECGGFLSKRDCARRSGFSARCIDALHADGTLPFEVIWKRARISFAAFEEFIPGGQAEWLTAQQTATELGKTKRQLECMRIRGVGPSYKFFSKKLLRYERASVAASKSLNGAPV